MTDKTKITNARRLELIKATNGCLYYCCLIISSLSRKEPLSEYLDYDAIKTASHTLESVCDRARKLAETETRE